MNDAKIRKPGDSSPHGSSKVSSDNESVKASPRKYFFVRRQAKSKVLPIRNSARIAERKEKAKETRQGRRCVVELSNSYSIDMTKVCKTRDKNAQTEMRTLNQVTKLSTSRPK